MAFWKRNTKPVTAQPATTAPASESPAEQAVLIKITSLRDPESGLDAIEDPIVAALQRSAVGEFDGNDVGPEGARLYLYGPDADAIWAAVDGSIDRASLGSGSHAILRHGPPKSPSSRVDLA